ncbi:hypothetical protein [Achromobacter marplatensis]|uniref:hypothetical protein n=1 Tax=Achromobacter marplatensis TaxID=470868 RepID=UPI0028E34E3D|nr:hypothetical protein [Achromobacter marplatensis]
MTLPPPSSPTIEHYRKYAQEVCEDLPSASYPVHVYALAVRILYAVFGKDWVDHHILDNDDKSSFFRNLEAAAGNGEFHHARVVDLAETIINLQGTPGLEDVISEMKLGHIEDRFAELEVCKILTMAGSRVNFVAPTGARGSSYDLEIETSAGKVCADVKCRIESNLEVNRDLNPNAILNTLKAARTQLPQDQMGALFLKLPQSWAPDGDITQLTPRLEKVAREFLRTTKRVVAIVMYFNMVLQKDGGLGVFTEYQQVLNVRHRFGTNEIPVLPQTLEPFLAPRPNWVRLANLFS